MSPDSKFFVSLNHKSKQAPAVEYHLIAGNTTNISAAYHDDDPAWKKVWNSISKRGKYLFADYVFFEDDPNDMIVKVDSMKKLPWGAHQQIEEVASDHLSYYRTEAAQKALKKVLTA